MASQPIKYHGGKWYLADQIISLFPPHLHYVEPFAGGLAVLFRKSCEDVSEVVNDINHELTDFWKCLQDPSSFAEFQRLVQAIPFSEYEWNYCCGEGNFIPGRVAKAVSFFVRYRQSRQGLGKDFATLSRNRVRRGMNEQVSSWLSAIEGLPEAHERLSRAVILNHDALDVIRQQDGPNTLFYCDPPYHHDSRAVLDAYEHEMTHEQHCNLLQVLSEIEGKFILSGYHSSLYDAWGMDHEWPFLEVRIDNKASSSKTKRVMTEVLWMNFAPRQGDMQ